MAFKIRAVRRKHQYQIKTPYGEFGLIVPHDDIGEDKDGNHITLSGEEAMEKVLMRGGCRRAQFYADASDNVQPQIIPKISAKLEGVVKV